jgi:hypothetical protein
LGGLTYQLEKPRSRGLAIHFLRPVLLREQDNHSVNGKATPSETLEALFHIVRESRAADIEAEFDG